MKCQFCKSEKEKLCKAHIIPESFFRFMYPNGKVEGQSLVMITDNKDYGSQRRVGIYDDSILCTDCDKTLGQKFDQYGKEILIDCEPELFSKVESGSVRIFKDADTNKLKLFILSVLWRFSISNLSELQYIKLPQKFEDRLLEMISKEDAGGLNDFSVFILQFDYLNKNKNFQKYIQIPITTRLSGLNYINIYFPKGYKILIKIDSRNQLESLVPLTLNNNSPVYITQYEFFEDTIEFQKLLQNAHKIKKHK